MLPFQIKADAGPGGFSDNVGISNAADPTYIFGSFTSGDGIDELMTVKALYMVPTGGGNYLLALAVRGPVGDEANLPAAATFISMNLTYDFDPDQNFDVLGVDASYEVGQLLGSEDPDDQCAFWFWELTAPVFNFSELALYSATIVDEPVPEEETFNCECDDETDNETLGALRRRLLVRLGYAAQADNPPPGMVDLLNDFLISGQRFLYRKYKELRTERFFKWDMVQGQRFYDLPENDDECDKKLDPYRLTWVGVQDLNDAWYPLIKGIPPTFYTGVQNLGLPSRYEIRQCIEVFPAPAEAYTLRIKGHFGLTAFEADEDKTTIHSELVFLWALANAKAHYGQPDANNIAAQANTYLGTLVAGAHQTGRYIPGTVALPPAVQPFFLPLGDP